MPTWTDPQQAHISELHAQIEKLTDAVSRLTVIVEQLQRNVLDLQSSSPIGGG